VLLQPTPSSRHRRRTSMRSGVTMRPAFVFRRKVETSQGLCGRHSCATSTARLRSRHPPKALPLWLPGGGPGHRDAGSQPALPRAELGIANGRLHHRDGVIIHLDRNRKRMTILAAMAEGEARGVAEPAWCAVDHLRDHRQGPYRAGADAGYEKQFGEVGRTAIGRCGERTVETPLDDIFAADIVMIRKHQVRKQGLPLGLARAGLQPRKLADDTTGTDRSQKLELPRARRYGAPIREIDDGALPRPFDGGVRCIHETLKSFRQPVMAPRLATIAIHALLDYDPIAVVGDDEAVKIEIEAVLDGGAVHFCHKATRSREISPVDAHALADGSQFRGRRTTMPAAAAADVDSKLARERGEPPASTRPARWW
jgi:hypothetical protein